MDALELIKTRRSTRKFRDLPVEEEKLEQILEAGRYAPSGKNVQSTHFIVIRDPKIIAELAELVKQEFAGMADTPELNPSYAGAVKKAKTGNYVFHYQPPVFIVTANRIGNGNHFADCACALENMMLMANALDLGSCWINQLRWLNENETVNAYLRGLGMADDEVSYGALSLGYPDTEDGLPVRTPLPRTGNPVTMVK